MIVLIFKLLGSLGVFLYGMRVMSDALQRTAGERLRRILNYMTANRYLAVLTGFIITALIQSSSATTVMVVSFVNASLLSLTQAIGVIMGANIGTTVTTWIVSLIGFKFNITAIALPIIGVGLPFMFAKTVRRRDFGEILIGFGLLFLGLMFLKDSVPNIKSNPEILEFLRNYTDLGFLSFVIFVLVGSVLTVVVQSSSAAMAITVTMAYMGWINFETSAAIVLGENIGTTVTAYLASLGTTVNARRAARAHFLFNTFGVIWMAIVFPYFIKLVLHVAPWDPYLVNDQGNMVNLPLNLALFHTMFNVTNTLICIPLISYITIAVTKLVKETPQDAQKEYRLVYISTSLQNTPELNIIKAREEITHMARVIDEMFETFLHVFRNPDKKMGNIVSDIKEKEDYTDQMQEQITQYLVQLSGETLSDANVKNINAMMRIVNELENIGDSVYKLMLLTQRKYDNKITLHPKAMNEFNDFVELIQEFIELYKQQMNEGLEPKVLDLAYRLENKINHLRDDLKQAAQERLQHGADVKSELLYLDLLKHFEHIGDKSLNIAQALRKVY
ncbi:MAG: Na/Pi cotransporter family protein [Candidatus Cloacimonetes bacterium]|nr:Na/Pi cotransporter family protein [Candidatus Cloacimonadota bacterium]